MKRLLSWGIFVLVVLAVYQFAGPTVVGGPASYVIVDGESMEPTYSDGDLVIAYQRGTYEVGDNIVYDAPIDSQFNVIHRIIEPTEGGWITQGDNMERPDGWIAPHDEIHGAALFHIPNGGAIVGFVRTPAALAGLLAGWVFFEVAKREEKKVDKRPKQRSALRSNRPRRRLGNKPANVLLVVLSLLLLSVFKASAASLIVNAGTLQTFQLPVDPEQFEAGGQDAHDGHSEDTTLDMNATTEPHSPESFVSQEAEFEDPMLEAHPPDSQTLESTGLRIIELPARPGSESRSGTD
jgi:signal peptidase I